MSQNLAWILLGLGIALLAFGILCTFLFVKFRKTKNAEKNSFKVLTGNNPIYRFWQYYAIIFLMFVSYLGTLILIPISIEALI